MDVVLEEGKKTEKEATVLEASIQKKKTDLELLKQIDEKLSLLLQTIKTETEE